ncbi:hypothetical protein NDU88_006573 [Pleurodeles waltl]|uniref:Uncharacterized protein n=1 Tax=Pleurodeles waltl TaxID=8319 RepID=A0AAV7PMT6_PLEWA|nr:hypothetical protein NDU88_006573 [Pleurodeles waltl]
MTGKGSARLARLASRLQEFNYKIEFIPGWKNVQADCLSRLALEWQSVDGGNVLEHEEEGAVASVGPPLGGAERESGRNSGDVSLDCPGTARAGNKRTLLRQQKKTLRRRVETRYRTGMLRRDALQNRNGSPVRRALGNALTGQESFRMERATERALHSWKPTVTRGKGVEKSTISQRLMLIQRTDTCIQQ